jgi:multiple sugar transport system substrate-binding protein
MAVTRRQFLIGAGLAAAATGGLSACGSDSGSGGGGEGGATNMTFAWWSNPTRTANTNKAIAAYMAANPGVTIEGQPGEFSSYWDKLATQTAGNTAPDIIQMDMNYISEYGTRGALLDLEENGGDVSKFAEGTVDSGRIDGKLVAINAGVNALCILMAPDIFEKAKMDLPDDTTWTWDELKEISAEVASKADVTAGIAGLFTTDGPLGNFVRQNGKELFTPDGLAFEAADAQAWFDLMVEFQKAKAIGTAENVSEEATKPLDQNAITVGTAAMQLSNSNQLEAFTAAAGKELTLLRLPSLTGQAVDRKAWYKASQLFSASARTKNPEAAVKFINWLVNSPESANINLAERGIPANTEMLALVEPKLSAPQKQVAKYIADIKPELAATPIAPPPGGGTIALILVRYATDVLFGRSSTADAGAKFVEELKSNLKV